MSDLISRQAAIDAVKKNTFRLKFVEEQNYESSVAWSTKAVYSDLMEEALLDLPSVQPDTTIHGHIPVDYISRQEALNLFPDDNLHWDTNEGYFAPHYARTLLRNLPSVQPERKTGRWTPDNTDYYRTKFICSVCGESEEVPTMGFGYAPMWGYCPNCGADMRGEKDATN